MARVARRGCESATSLAHSSPSFQRTIDSISPKTCNTDRFDILSMAINITACAYRIFVKSCVFTILDSIGSPKDDVILTASILVHDPARAYAPYFDSLPKAMDAFRLSCAEHSKALRPVAFAQCPVRFCFDVTWHCLVRLVTMPGCPPDSAGPSQLQDHVHLLPVRMHPDQMLPVYPRADVARRRAPLALAHACHLSPCPRTARPRSR